MIFFSCEKSLRPTVYEPLIYQYSLKSSLSLLPLQTLRPTPPCHQSNKIVYYSPEQSPPGLDKMASSMSPLPLSTLGLHGPVCS